MVGSTPPWLKPLLSTSFFAPCSFHPNATKNECNMYCLDCTGAALCSYCLSCHHHRRRNCHRLVQIRRSSYHDVVRVSEVSALIDLSGVQSYVINSHRVVFLNGRPQARQGKGVTSTCEACGRSILDSFRFCSLGCKMEGMERDPWLSFEVCSASISSSEEESGKRVDDGGESSGNNSMSPATPPIVSCRVSRRKGVPRRAPPF